MEYINLHVVAPMSHQLVAAGFPFIHFKYTQGPTTTELTIPSSYHRSIDIKFQNLPCYEYIKSFLEKYGRLNDTPHPSEEENKKSWLLDLNQAQDLETAKELMNLFLHIVFERVYDNFYEIGIKIPTEITTPSETIKHTVVETPGSPEPGE